ncbi:MAG TPA: hypothetical protein VIN59_03530 [Alphaproteobacteria bacterium]
MNFKNTFMLLGATALLAACAVQSTTEATKPNEARSGLWGMNKQADLQVDNEKAFAGVNKVIIGSFKVGFLEGKKDSAKAGSGMGGKATAKTSLEGLTPAVMQAVTDAAYKDFVTSLETKGYTVADRSQLLADAEYAGTESSPSPLREEASFFGSANTVTYVAPSGFEGIRFFIGEAGKGTGLGAMNGPWAKAIKFAKNTGIPVLSVYYLVDYANTAGNVSHYALMSSVNVGQGISATIGSGVMLVGGEAGGTFGPNPNGSVKLGQAVFSEEKFGELRQDTTGAGVAAEVALNIFTSALGGGSNQTREFTIVADPAKYQQVASNVLGQANNVLVSKMASMK